MYETRTLCKFYSRTHTMDTINLQVKYINDYEIQDHDLTFNWFQRQEHKNAFNLWNFQDI